MKAGQLRHRVTIQSRTTARDAHDDPIATWSTVVKVWASIEPLNARELILAQQVESNVTHKVTIRYRSGVTSAMRVVFGSRTFEIDSVINTDERNITMVLMCEETT